MTGTVVADVDQPVERFGRAWVARMGAHIAEQLLPDRAHPGDIGTRRKAAPLRRGVGGDDIRQSEREFAGATQAETNLVARDSCRRDRLKPCATWRYQPIRPTLFERG